MRIDDEIAVMVDGVPVVGVVLGCDLLDPMGYDERWSCRVALGERGECVVVVCVWGGAIVDMSDVLPLG